MNGNRAKKIRKMCDAKDPKILLSIRNEYGEGTKRMDVENNIYKYAKKIWKNKRPTNWFK